MGRNLPPLTPRQRRETPWNQRQPDPAAYEVECSECGWCGSVEESEYDGISYCPECGEEAKPP